MSRRVFVGVFEDEADVDRAPPGRSRAQGLDDRRRLHAVRRARPRPRHGPRAVVAAVGLRRLGVVGPGVRHVVPVLDDGPVVAHQRRRPAVELAAGLRAGDVRADGALRRRGRGRHVPASRAGWARGARPTSWIRASPTTGSCWCSTPARRIPGAVRRCSTSCRAVSFEERDAGGTAHEGQAVNLVLAVAVRGVIVGVYAGLDADPTVPNWEFLPNMVRSVPADAFAPAPLLRGRPDAAGAPARHDPARAAAAALRGRRRRTPSGRASSSPTRIRRTTPAALARGCRGLRNHCAVCHGASGLGDGPVTCVACHRRRPTSPRTPSS